MFLNVVVKEKKDKVKEWKSKVPLIEIKKRADGIEKRPFYDIFRERSAKEVKIIAELKKASPSAGLLKENLNVDALICDYVAGGAKAVSVITEEKYFKGSVDLLSYVRKITCLPLLRKDFIVDEYELYQAKACGADAVLLIAEALESGQIKDYLEIAREIDLDVLVEVHSLASYDKISDFKNYLLGINNRDLKSLTVDLSISERIIKDIPTDLPVIVESGIKTRNDIERFLKLKVSGFLIGTNLVLSDNPKQILEDLQGIA